eukprot:3810992-Rhodomonas_salina.1
MLRLTVMAESGGACSDASSWTILQTINGTIMMELALQRELCPQWKYGACAAARALFFSG